MKKIFILLFIGASMGICAQETNTEVSQSDYDRWSIELAGGVHKPTRSFAPGYFANTPSFGQASLGVRYMFNNKFGLKLDGGYANIEGDDQSLQFKTTNYRGSLQGVINLGNLLDFGDWTNNIGLLIHGGGGYSFNSFDEEVAGSIGNDEMLHIMAGITPQVKLSNSLALTLDVSAIGNVRQSRTWDGTLDSPSRGVDGFIVNASAGLTWYIGKNKKHADWVGNDSLLEDKVLELEERLAKVETDLIDTDQDGVADYLDREPNTISGVAVNTKGIAVDQNKNGVPDELESTLDKRYLNKNDYKPTTTTVSGGNMIKNLINDGYVNVYFKFNSTKPQDYSLEAINYLKVYLKDNPTATAELIGYADELGNASYNSTLSERRAKMVYDVLVASGVSSSRLSHRGNGEDTSVDKNSAQARQLVRRVTFKLNK
jgi:OOP family OmpA-OmpF porin